MEDLFCGKIEFLEGEVEDLRVGLLGAGLGGGENELEVGGELEAV